jgi:hypothetical protein
VLHKIIPQTPNNNLIYVEIYRFVEPVHLINKQNPAFANAQVVLGLLHGDTYVFRTRKNRRPRNKGTVERCGRQARQSGFTNAGETPKHHGMRLA